MRTFGFFLRLVETSAYAIPIQNLFGGMMTPKDEEITASPRFEDPTRHFEESLSKALSTNAAVLL